MRYRRGTIIITEKGDIPLLRHVRNCRFVSRSQLFHLLEHETSFVQPSVHGWRINRLLRGDYIRLLNSHKHRRSAIFSIAPMGLAELERHGDYCPSLSSETRHMPHPLQVHHCLELTDIHLALIRSSILVHWKSEVEISSENLVYGRFQKNYDAVVTVRTGKELRLFALEYERTPKTGRRYTVIREKIENERDIPCVLYLAASSRIARLLALRLTPMTKPLAITLAHSFRQKLLGAEVMTNHSSEVVSIDNFLASAPTLAPRRAAGVQPS
jgi:hypothetical protein